MLPVFSSWRLVRRNQRRQQDTKKLDREVQVLRQACEILLYALILGLPFEYYFYTTTESLYTSLKLQLILFLGCWILMKIAERARSSGSILRRLGPSLPPRLLLSSLFYIISYASFC